MFEKDEDYRKARKESKDRITKVIKVWSAREETLHDECFQKGAEFGYNKANESHSPDEHIDKDKVVLGIIKLCNKTRYSLVQWNGEWWYQYGTFNAEVRLIAWYNIPELPKESE